MEPISLCDSDSIFTFKVLIILLLLKCVLGIGKNYSQYYDYKC